MAKSIGVAGVLVLFFSRKLSLHGRRLSSDEAQLLEQYRAPDRKRSNCHALFDWCDEEYFAFLNRVGAFPRRHERGNVGHQLYLRLSGAGGKYWYNQVSLKVRSLVRMNRRISTGATLSLVGYQSKRMR